MFRVFLPLLSLSRFLDLSLFIVSRAMFKNNLTSELEGMESGQKKNEKREKREKEKREETKMKFSMMN